MGGGGRGGTLQTTREREGRPMAFNTLHRTEKRASPPNYSVSDWSVINYHRWNETNRGVISLGLYILQLRIKTEVSSSIRELAFVWGRREIFFCLSLFHIAMIELTYFLDLSYFAYLS